MTKNSVSNIIEMKAKNMTKKETIWREILFQASENKKINFTQKELAQKFGFSLSTVFNSLKTLRQSNAIEVSGRGFEVQDIEKFILLWASFRNLKKDIIYQTFCSKSVREIESEMPPKIIFAGYSAFLKKYQTAPADYDKVYVYADLKVLEELRQRFPSRKGNFNLIVLKADKWLCDFGFTTPNCQTFVDLWNLPEWYAKDFLKELKDKMF
ncbi:MAG: winged helix-turn-helix domain-containing protein [bacterium]|nr:winged helix-turn-helix domain-containing protein [bacterium]